MSEQNTFSEQPQSPEQPKIIIDSDWKTQAQAEKQKLTEQAAAKAPAEKTPHEIGFVDLVGMLAQQAASFLGYYPDPQTGKAMVSLEYAKLHIDLLGVLEAKTQGNLSLEEQMMLTRLMTDLRADFVAMAKEVSKAVQEGRLRPGQAAGADMTAGPAAPAPDLST